MSRPRWAELEWARDSAFRFFPLLRHDELGLVLHPFDLATNKVLALVGRLEVRDWIDVIESHERLQPLGYLAWAACGKDPAFSPGSILDLAARSARYPDDEVRQLAFAGAPPDAKDLAVRWHAALAAAREIVQILPPAETGKCVLDPSGALHRGSASDLPESLRLGRVLFHQGRIRGAIPTLKR
ncbi:MAG: hypothetical protein L6Q95_06515 [Planctomycetes bacterium]|nr:hypothetical protein [Planctomycetota bacterium]